MDRKNQQGVVYLIPLLILFLAAGFFLTTVNRSQLKNMTSSVLSSSDESDNSGSGSSGGEGDDNSGSGGGEDDDRSDDNSGSGSSDSGSDSGNDSNDDSSGSGSGEDEREVEEERIDVRYDSGLRIRQRIDEDEERFDVYEAGIHYRIRTRDGVTRLSIENDEGEEVESKVAFRSNFPVSVDETTGVLTVTTPRGSKDVAVLPQAAIDNILGQRVVDVVLPDDSRDEQELEFEEDEDGELVYIIDGAIKERLLGLFEVYIPKTITISAEDGEVKEVEVSFFNRLLDALSF